MMLRLLRDAIIVLILTILAATAIHAVFAHINLGAFNPEQASAEDLDFTDLYYRKNRNVIEPSEIVLVNTGSLDDTDSLAFRRGFAGLLAELQTIGAKVIGIDVEFKETNDSISNALLVNSVENCSNCVGVRSSSPIGILNMPYKSVGSAQFLAGRGSTVRSFAWRSHSVEDGEGMPSFAAAVLELANPEFDLDQTIETFGEEAPIDFLYEPGKFHNLKYADEDYSDEKNANPMFKAVEAHDILYRPDTSTLIAELQDKIVLVGHLGRKTLNQCDHCEGELTDRVVGDTLDLEDMHISPMHQPHLLNRVPNTHGLVIHAEAIQMALSGRTLKMMSWWLDAIVKSVVWIMLSIIFLVLAKHVQSFKLFAILTAMLFSILTIFISYGFRQLGIVMEVGLLNIVAFVLVEGVEVFHVIVHSKLGKKFLKKSYLSDHA